MTEIPKPHAQPEPAPPAPTRSRWAWRPKLRWFAAEIVVVVAGVLIALAFNAWWTDRQSAAQERVYLQQLAADLEATARRFEGSVAAMKRSMNVSAKLLIAYTAPE